ncbi:MAG: hypothetical protein H0T76_18765 [Nannocystis sp.]|nr:hypothetical protein [Nannocystis sp.]MBA3548530.1 hypothetical protein [Nannocystis sp.]
MLIIRDAQIDTLRQEARDRFAAGLSRHLRVNYPGATAAVGGEVELRAFVGRAIDRSARHGIGGEGSVTVFTELLLQYGEDFERSPLREWVGNILAHPALPGSAKAGTIRERHEELTQGRVVVKY